MGKTTFLIAFKIFMTFIVAWIAFGVFDGTPLGWIFIVALVGSIINYLLGDLYILPRFNNLTASIIDGIMAIVVAYIVALLTVEFVVSLLSLITFGVLVIVIEYLFHTFLINTEDVADRD